MGERSYIKGAVQVKSNTSLAHKIEYNAVLIPYNACAHWLAASSVIQDAVLCTILRKDNTMNVLPHRTPNSGY
eukprot:4221817-Pyramimonas_sp.AAC.1